MHTSTTFKKITCS